LNYSRVIGFAAHLPGQVLTNDEISSEFPEWEVSRISAKTGIETRHISSENEFSSDLAIAATEKLIAKHSIARSDIDYLLVVTQTPDRILPGIAPLVHEAIGMRSSAGAVDLNLGCSGYVYGLGVAKGLIESGQAANVLLVTSDTYTKLLNPKDKSVRTIFGDGATATWIGSDGAEDSITGFSYGTDGSGYSHLMVPNGGLKRIISPESKSSSVSRNFQTGAFDLYMDGPEIFNFTLRVVGDTLQEVLEKSKLKKSDVDFFVFHQANAFMLTHLVKKLEIPEEKAPILMRDWGNTVSGTIPMALIQMSDNGQLKPGSRLVLLGFGVGLSWAGVSLLF
jgi:3-oxoacyl-[acyl-carrier-protein] synthase-3